MIEFNLCRLGRHGEGRALGKTNEGSEWRWRGDEAYIACTRVLGSPWACWGSPPLFADLTEVP